MEIKNRIRFNIKYKVFVDGVQADRTVLLPTGCYYVFDIPLEPGSSELRLVCEPGVSIDHNNDFMHSEWVGAAFELDHPASSLKTEEIFRSIRDWFESVLEDIRRFFANGNQQ